MWLADPAIPRRGSGGARQALGRARSRGGCRSTAGPSEPPPSSAASRRFRPMPSSGKPMADRESEVIAKIASGVAGLNARALGPARRRRSVRQPRLPVGARGFGQRRPGHRLDAGADPGRGRRRAPGRRRAGLSQDPQPGRICVRPRLGRGVGARGRAILSQAAGRGAVHAGARAAAARRTAAAAARRDRGGDGPERHVVGAHHLHRRSRRRRVRAARLADPPRRPISLVQPRLSRASTISSPR